MMNKQQMGPPIDISQATPVHCEKCENDTFRQVLKMRKLSALLSPSGQDKMIPIQLFECASCNHINSEFLPPEEKK